VFDERRHDLNVALAFAGLQVREDGKLEGVALATTLTEAAQRASRLRSELMRRGISGEVLRYCQPELLEGDYFHAVFEATKSIAQNRLAREPRGRTRPPSCLTQVRWSDPFFARAPSLVCGGTNSDGVARCDTRGTTSVQWCCPPLDALLRGTTPVAQDTPAEQDRIREFGLVIADVYRHLHGLDHALGCSLDCPNLVVLWVEEEPNDLRLRGGSRLRDGLLQNHVTSRGRSRGLGRVQDADVEGFADGVRPGFLARWHVSTSPTRLVPAGTGYEP